MKRLAQYLLSIGVVLSLVVGLLPGVVLAQGGETVRIGDWESPDPMGLPAEVTVGVIFDLSGGAAVYGEVQQRAAQLAVEEINASGYLGSSQLVAIYEDGGSAGETSINAMTKLVEQDGVAAVMGPTLSSEAFSADPIAQEAGIPVLGVSNTASGLTDMGEFVFRDSLPESSVIPGTIAAAKAILGLSRVGVLYGNDDDFTYSGYEVFMDALAAEGIEVTAEETFARGDVDFNAQLTNIIATSPDAIVVSALVQEAVPLVSQARQLGFAGPIIGGNGFNSPALVSQAGEAANGVIVGAAWNIANQNPYSVAFTEAYQAAYTAAPDQFAAQAYTGMWLIATAIRRADSADPAAIRDALAGITDFGSPLGAFSFDANRDPVHEPVTQIIADGAYTILGGGAEAASIGDWSVADPMGLPAEVTVGVIFDLSGGAAVYGEVQQRAAQLAVEEINASGYLGSSQLVAIYEDGGSAGETSINAMTKLVEQDGVAAVMGPTLSSEAFSADPIAQEAGIPVLGVSNTASGLTDMGEFVFRDSLPESSVIPGTIAAAKAILGLARVGVLYGNDDDFTYSGYEVFMDALSAEGIEVTAEETFARGDVDFNAQLTNIIATSPDAIVVSALVQEAVPLVSQARQLGFAGPIIGGNGFNSPALVAQAGEAANGVIVGAAWNIANQNPYSVAFTEAYQAAYTAAPDQFAAQAYTGMWLIATAIRRADSADPAAIRDALAGITDFGSPLGAFSFDANRDPVHEPVTQIIADGAYTLLTAETAQ